MWWPLLFSRRIYPVSGRFPTESAVPINHCNQRKTLTESALLSFYSNIDSYPISMQFRLNRKWFLHKSALFIPKIECVANRSLKGNACRAERTELLHFWFSRFHGCVRFPLFDGQIRPSIWIKFEFQRHAESRLMQFQRISRRIYNPLICQRRSRRLWMAGTPLYGSRAEQ